MNQVTILVLDDSEPIRRAATRILERNGFTTYSAESAHEAKAMLDDIEGPIDLLLCDLVLPGLDGREAANLLIAHHPDMKVLFMSGYSSPASFRLDLEAHERVFLSKPFDESSLLEAVGRALAMP